MSGLVALVNPHNRGHLHVVVELSGPAQRLHFWDQRGLGVVRLVAPAEFHRYGEDRIGPDALEISAAELHKRCTAVAAPSRWRARSHGGGHREYLCIGDPAPHRRSSRRAVQPAETAAMDETARADGRGAVQGTPRRRLHAAGQTLSHGRRSFGQLSVPRLSATANRACAAAGPRSCASCRRRRATFFCPACQRGLIM